MRILICGSRHWSDPDPIAEHLDTLLDEISALPLVVIEGEASGADSYAKWWAQCHIIFNWYWDFPRTVGLEQYPAKWDEYGKAAGPIRNRQMLEEGKPDMVVGFSEDIEKSRGTANMLAQARKAGVPTILRGSACGPSDLALR